MHENSCSEKVASGATRLVGVLFLGRSTLQNLHQTGTYMVEFISFHGFKENRNSQSILHKYIKTRKFYKHETALTKVIFLTGFAKRSGYIAVGQPSVNRLTKTIMLRCLQ
jgi:hypothetical protein